VYLCSCVLLGHVSEKGNYKLRTKKEKATTFKRKRSKEQRWQSLLCIFTPRR
jgi:hypothetical protein